MALKFEIDTLDGLDESIAPLYEAHGDKFRLSVDGIDPADELKEALRKERELFAASKKKLKEIEEASHSAESKRLEEKQEFELLWKAEKEAKATTEKELSELRDKVSNGERNLMAENAINGLIDKSVSDGATRNNLLRKEALALINSTPEGIKINAPDGSAWDAKQLGAYLAEQYPFLVDGSKSSGGGAGGNSGGGAAAKKFSEMSGAELKALRESNPTEYDRLRSRR